jgi:hypothetical protein
MQNLDSQTVQLAIVAAVALVMLLQAIFLLALFITVRKAARGMREDIEELRSSVVPVIDNVKELLVKTGPKIEAAAADLAAMSHNLRRQTVDVQAAAGKIIDRALDQTARMDSMLTGIFDAVDRAAGFMSDAVSVPMRQLAGFLASAKAVVETLRTGVNEPQPPGGQPRGEKDMFV